MERPTVLEAFLDVGWFWCNCVVMLAIFSIVVIAQLAFKLWWDKRAKDNGRVINHFRSALIDGGIYVVVAFFTVGLNWVLLAVAFRWIAFDILFNRLNGWEWDHYGNSSALDKFLKDLGVFHLVPKIILLIIALCLALRL